MSGKVDLEKTIGNGNLGITTTPSLNELSSDESKGTGEIQDAFGDEANGEVQYKTMTWWQGAIVMIAENISLGILSLPAVVAKVGLVGAIIGIVGLGILTTYSGYVLWQFKMRYPQIINYADIGGVLIGPWGKEAFGVVYILFMIFCMASHLLTFTIALNVLTEHGACTIIWGVVGVVVFSILSIPRTLKNISFLSIISFVSILSAVIVTMVALGISPKAAQSEMKATYTVAFPTAFNSMSSVVFAYAGHVAWISFISELQDPKDYPKSLILLQSVDMSMYLVAAVVIYRYAGVNVDSPALSSTSIIVKKVAWGIALPTIVIAGVIFAHVSIKYVYIRMFANTRHLHSRGWVATGTWIGLGTASWIIAFIIAESIPIFSDLLGFISALFASWFSYGIPGVCWFYLNRGEWFKNKKNWWLSGINGVLILLSIVICCVGLYASSYQMSIDADYKSDTSHVWSCADNQH